ncbi:unnamed protein product [Enterobius vermicularis]|uniref:G_PROTEIN_RECEP_F1_2 domain-containing protein n=1 Tax=Enterobius vermicularis TaxID=51028 RepID=A0A0N4VD57_ENTVE|nr:unnamed protein product [Enterobius vermicularis]
MEYKSISCCFALFALRYPTSLNPFALSSKNNIQMSECAYRDDDNDDNVEGDDGDNNEGLRKDFTEQQRRMCDNSNECYTERFWLIGITGSLLAIFGVISNALLTIVFLSNLSYRRSPFFFLGFVALYDTLLDFTYMSVPICAGFTTDLSICLLWYHYSQPFHLFAQIFKISSVFCLIAASIERYLMTRHWTFTGFEHRTRWLILIIIVAFAVIIKTATCSFLLLFCIV